MIRKKELAIRMLDMFISQRGNCAAFMCVERTLGFREITGVGGFLSKYICDVQWDNTNSICGWPPAFCTTIACADRFCEPPSFA